MSNVRTGGQVIADHLAANDVPYVAGIPGHGSLPMVDALAEVSKPRFLQVRHEQAAVHLADGYYRASGKPLAVFTSIGPGAATPPLACHRRRRLHGGAGAPPGKRTPTCSGAASSRRSNASTGPTSRAASPSR